ncbi:MAG: MBL fold metallo-hydrolase [Desulfovibrio sp.]|jgi:metallo-beta-lactamase family protein|nr:MBL fold metallo-hydrolase [Desulfovibrio sp.]
MKVRFLGAAKTVTGSCHVIEAAGGRFCVDCGMHQGNKAIESRNSDVRAYRPRELDFILMTHAHIDHSGLLPMLVREGFDKPVYCTGATAALLRVMLEDSAHIQETEAQRRSEKYRRRGLKNPRPPLYTVDDARKAVNLLRVVDYHQPFEPAPGVSTVFYDAGHILGSGTLRLEIMEDGQPLSLIFSGDIGRKGALIVRDPEQPPIADYIFMESTYGDRDHKNESDSADELAEALAWSYARKEKVIIPAFAVERTQEILYCLHMLNRDGRLPGDMPVIVDSPLAIRATEIFQNNYELFDDEAKKLLADRENPFALPNLRFTLSSDESRALNSTRGPAVVISASGMCNAGRVLHHLKHNIWRPGASVVFVGYQAAGTPGRKLVEKAKKISLFGEDMEVAARILTINGFSGHAGQGQLLDWLAPLAVRDARLVLIHGEERAQNALAALIKQRFGMDALIPGYLDEIVLEKGRAVRTEAVEEAAHPAVNWEFLTAEVERKWAIFKSKADSLGDRPWVEQTDTEEALAKLDYALTRLISRL